ncbi:MAG: hypothetical protein JXA69_04540, partial [Phycisphaerae bacterium]|nr:hypothetical protein [Phycisphaerae bacterium]
GFDGVLEWIKSTCLPEGEPASVHGMEYDAYYGAGLLGYCYGATIRQDPVAAALEEQAARQLVRHTRAIRLYDYHRNSWAKAAAAWLMHKYAGPRIKPVSFAEAWQALCGTYHYRWQQNLIHRDASKWASFTWGSLSGDKAGRPTAFVVPTRNLAPAMEPLVYLHTQSLVGETRFTPAEGEAKTSPAESIYRCVCTDVEYHTAGCVSDGALDRHYAFWSFPNGPCAMATVFRAKCAGRLSWSGQPIYFYVRPGITQSRTLTGKQGAQLLEETAVRKSSWWCVDDKLGVAVLGSERTIKVDRTPGFNWARTDTYRDKCDGVYVGPVDAVEVAPGNVPVDQTVAILTGTAPDRVADVAKGLRTLDQPLADGSGLPLPEGWRCVVVTDPAQSGKRYLGVANLFGEQTHAHLSVGFDEGAPLGAYDATILRNTAAVTLSLANADSCAETIELYATVLVGKGIRARKLTHNRYRFCPLGQHPVRLRLTYTGAGAEAFIIHTTGNVPASRIVASALDDSSFGIEVNAPTVLEIAGEAYDDRTGPAVEITGIEVLVNRQVIVEVTAADQSGIDAVELFCDGQSLGRSALAPYRWTHRATDGAHTYHAVAVDASGHANERASFRQTVTVAAP